VYVSRYQRATGGLAVLTRLRDSVVVLLVPIVLLGSAPYAAAAVRTFRDGDNPNPHAVDISSVRVDNSTLLRRQVIVNVYVNGFDDPRQHIGLDAFDLYLDTNASRRGPEFRVHSQEGLRLVHMRTWTRAGRVVHCDDPSHGESGYFVQRLSQPNRYRVWIKRVCLGNPGRVRVAVHVARQGSSTVRASQDWAKARRSWLGWVPR
jgi:hypothetical protein